MKNSFYCSNWGRLLTNKVMKNSFCFSYWGRILINTVKGHGDSSWPIQKRAKRPPILSADYFSIVKRYILSRSYISNYSLNVNFHCKFPIQIEYIIIVTVRTQKWKTEKLTEKKKLSLRKKDIGGTFRCPIFIALELEPLVFILYFSYPRFCHIRPVGILNKNCKFATQCLARKPKLSWPLFQFLTAVYPSGGGQDTEPTTRSWEWHLKRSTLGFTTRWNRLNTEPDRKGRNSALF